MGVETMANTSPHGRMASAAGRERAARRPGYRGAREEYAAIATLRKKNWIAAHIRERRYELELTQRQVADAVGTSHTYISKVERGDDIPSLLVLARIVAALGEELILGIQRPDAPDAANTPGREIARLPELV